MTEYANEEPVAEIDGHPVRAADLAEMQQYKGPGSLPQREGVPVEPGDEETCDTCFHGRGDFINDGENEDFYCRNSRGTFTNPETVPYNERINKTPETPACEIHLLVIQGYRERMAGYQQRREDRQPVYRGEDGTDLTDQQHRDELDAARQHEKGIRQPSNYKIMRW